MASGCSETKRVECRVEFEGSCNSLLIWCELELIEGLTCRSWHPALLGCTSTAELQEAMDRYQVLSSMGPYLQDLQGLEQPLAPGDVLELTATHNTQAMRFGLASKSCRAAIQDAGFLPQARMQRLVDREWREAWGRAVRRALELDRQAHVLDVCSGSGFLSLTAASSGAASVTACDLLEPLCRDLRTAAAAQGVSDQVVALHMDGTLFEPGTAGAARPSLVLLDTFRGADLSAHLAALQLTRSKILGPGARVLPQRAVFRCIGLELRLPSALGLDLGPAARYLFAPECRRADVSRLPPHRVLTEVAEVFDVSLQDPSRKEGGGAGPALVRLRASCPGILNAVLCWVDLHLVGGFDLVLVI